ncbi:hypothetical protein SynMITS9220_01657 [Synechococcus sp. MIT S9220]|nr:hypothetical protein SynMITS9220_01657 [Synechococcus sp. MIT S9220]
MPSPWQHTLDHHCFSARPPSFNLALINLSGSEFSFYRHHW